MIKISTKYKTGFKEKSENYIISHDYFVPKRGQ